MFPGVRSLNISHMKCSDRRGEAFTITRWFTHIIPNEHTQCVSAHFSTINAYGVIIYTYVGYNDGIFVGVMFKRTHTLSTLNSLAMAYSEIILTQKMSIPSSLFSFSEFNVFAATIESVEVCPTAGNGLSQCARMGGCVLYLSYLTLFIKSSKIR